MERRRFQLPFWRHGLWFGIFGVVLTVQSGRFVADLLSGDAPSTATTAIALGVSSVAAILAWRVTFAGVYANQDGVAIVGPLRTRRIGWREIAEFGMRDWGPVHGALGNVELVDGGSIAIWGLGKVHSVAGIDDATVGEGLVGALNKRLVLEKERAREQV